MSEGVFAHWPNRITAIRFVGAMLLFVILSLAERPETRTVAHVCFWLFLVVAVTDVLDGYLARRDNLVTAFGRVADPFVDKVLVLGTMIFLAAFDWSKEWFPPWVVVIVLSREFLVTGLRGYVETLGLPFPADWFGKVKMALQCTAISIVFGMFAFGLEETFWRGVVHVLIWAILVSSVGSGVTYVLRSKRLIEAAA